MAEISREVNIEMLEKLPDGTFKKKNPATKAQVVEMSNGQDVETVLNQKENTLPADQKRKITFGTAEPSGGNDGDIYFQYE